jgi:hypothetical protein
VCVQSRDFLLFWFIAKYKEPFAATDGDYALKYFLVDRAKKRNDIDLHMKHSRGRPTAIQQQQQVQPKDENE